MTIPRLEAWLPPKDGFTGMREATVVVQFDKEASQTRDLMGRAAGSDPSLRKERLLNACLG